MATSSKRRAQKKCEVCDATVTGGKTQCGICAAAERERLRREAECDTHTFLSPAGVVREVTIRRRSVHKSMVFQPGGGTFSESDPCGDFLDALLAVVFARPEYIRPDDVNRYASWIDCFRSHDFGSYWDGREMASRPMETLPLERLGYALRSWVNTFLRDDAYLLSSTLAIDAARFILGHACGIDRRNYSGDDYEIRGLLNHGETTRLAGVELADPRLKLEITSRIKGANVRCLIPAGGSLTFRDPSPIVLGPGDAFVFELERCHLTNENYYQRPCIRAAEADPPRYDIADELWLRGILLCDAETWQPLPDLATLPDDSWQLRHGRRWCEIPVRWITDCYAWDHPVPTPRLVPVPRYAA